MSSQVGRSRERARGRGLLRRLLALAGALVVIVVGAALALKLMFPPEKLRALVLPRLEAAVGREVELGSVRLKILPRLAVRLDHLAIANPPGFSPEPMLTLDALDLEVRLRPLLRRELELNRVRLIRLAIRYEVNAEGVSNFAGLGATASSRTARLWDVARAGGAGVPALAAAGLLALPAGMRQATEVRPARAALVVSDLMVREGSVIYFDRRTGRGARLEFEAELAADRVAGSKDALQGDGRIEARSIRLLLPDQREDSIAFPDASLEFRGLLVHPRDDYLVAEDLVIDLGDVRLSGSLSVRPLRGERTLDLSLESDEVEIAELLAMFPVADRLENIDAEGRARFSLRAGGVIEGGARPWLNGNVMFEQVSLTYGGYGRLLTNASGSLAFDTSSLSVPSFQGDLFGRPFQFSLSAAGFANPIVDGRASASIDLARLAELREGFGAVEGAVEIDLRFQGTARRPESLRIEGPVTLSHVRYRGESLAVPAEIRAAKVQLTGAGVSAEAIPIRLGSSDVTLSFSAPGALPYLLSRGTKGAAPTVRFTVRSNRLHLGEIRAEEETAGYAELVAARLAGRRLDGRDPAELARDRYELPPIPLQEASGRVEIRRLINPPKEARDVSFDVTLRGGILGITNIEGQMYGGHVSGALSLDFRQGRSSFPLSYEFQLRDAQAGGLLARWTRLGSALSGAVDFNVSGTTALDDAFLPSLDLTEARGRADFRDGRFQDFGITRMLIKQFKLDPNLITRFERFGGAYEIKEGAFLLDSWNFAAGDIKAVITGAAGLGGTLDLELAMRVPLSLLQEAGLVRGMRGLGGLLGRLAGDDELIDLTLGVGGTISNPILQVDTEALQKTLEKRLEAAGVDLLRRLFKPPQQDVL